MSSINDHSQSCGRKQDIKIITGLLSLLISASSSSLSGDNLKAMIINSPYHSGFIKGHQFSLSRHLTAADDKLKDCDKQRLEEFSLGYIFGARMARKFAQAVKIYSSQKSPEWTLGYDRGYQLGQIIVGKNAAPERSVTSIALNLAKDSAMSNDQIFPDLPAFKDKSRKQLILGLMLLWFQKEWKPEEDSAGADEKVKPSLANNEKNENINEDSEDHKNEPSAEYIESHDQDIRNQNALDSEKQDDDKTNHVDPDSNNTEKTSHNTSHSDQPETIEKVVIKCSECSQKLRVIKGKNLKINCPRCKQTFKTIT